MGASHAHTLYVSGHSRIHHLAPEVKLLAAFAFVLVVALTPREAIWVFGVDAAVLVLIVALAGIPARFVLARLSIIVPFIAFAFLIPFVGSGERIDVLGVAVSEAGLWGMWNIVAKSTLGATTTIALAATTELSAILQGLGRLKVPASLTAIAAFMMRYLELVTNDLRRMRTAMTARCYDPSWLWQIRPIAASAGTLFVRCFERGERIHAAMLSRGYTGVLPTLETRPTPSREWLLGAVPALLAALAAAGAGMMGT